MLVEKVVNNLPMRSNFVKLIIGSALCALAISLGCIGVSRLFALPVNNEIAVALGCIGAAIYGIKVYRKKGGAE